MSDLVDTCEMYLRTVINLEEEGIVPLRARIAERLGHTGPTVFQTVGRMQRDGLLVVSSQKNLVLTSKGRRAALSVVRKHRLAELLLYEVIGLEWEYLHSEACRLEHVISDRLEARLLRLLQNPQETPYGTPIPPVDEGFDLENLFRGSLLNLSQAVPQGASVLCRIRRIGEIAQTDTQLLKSLSCSGLKPGTCGRFEHGTDGLLAWSESGEQINFFPHDIDSIFVEVVEG